MIQNRKQIFFTSVLASMLLVPTLQAGMVIDVQVGGGIWKPELSGNMQYGTGFANKKFDFNKIGVEDAETNLSSNNYLYLDVDHFLPLIPNIRIERLRYAITGDATITEEASFGDIVFSKDQTSKTDLQLTQNDIILYWGIPGLNTISAGILDVDFGIMGKQLDGYYEMTNTSTNETETVDFDVWVPMGYLAAQVYLPVLPIELEASLKQISYEDSQISDKMIKASILLPIPIPLIDTKLDIGYREQQLTIAPDLISGFNADIKSKGLFFGISAKF